MSLQQCNFGYRYCVLRLQFATETLLVRHGAEIVNDHMNLRRLADCIIDIYMMTASIGENYMRVCNNNNIILIFM